MKKILMALILSAIWAGAANATIVNSQGTAGACVAVTTGSAVSVLLYAATRTSATLYSDQAMNCEPGPATGGAPATAPTTGAIGTGAGYPFAAATYISIGPGRALPLGATSNPNLNLDPAARLDCIAATTNGHVCTWEGQ